MNDERTTVRIDTNKNNLRRLERIFRSAGLENEADDLCAYIPDNECDLGLPWQRFGCHTILDICGDQVPSDARQRALVLAAPKMAEFLRSLVERACPADPDDTSFYSDIKRRLEEAGWVIE